MKIIINIEGRDIAFASNGATLLLYKRQFKKDFLKEILSVTKAMSPKKENKDIKNDTDDGEIDIENFDFELINAIGEFAYICAKTANKDIGEYEQWMAEFDDPIALLGCSDEIMSLIGKGFVTSVEPKDKKKPKGS